METKSAQQAVNEHKHSGCTSALYLSKVVLPPISQEKPLALHEREYHVLTCPVCGREYKVKGCPMRFAPLASFNEVT